MGLNVDVGVASAYVWRGLNIFQGGGQSDQNFLLAPSVTWSVAGTGLSVGYWGAYQLNGGNASTLVNVGYGAEQDLILGYETALTDTLSLGAGLVYYFYPLADEEKAGTANPSYLEPGICLSWEGPVTLALKLSYLAGLQDALKNTRYLYINPTLSRGFRLSATVSVELAAGLGYKVYNDPDAIEEGNFWDIQFTAALPVQLGRFYVKPSLGVAWTDLHVKTRWHELAPWGGVNVGADF